MLNLRLLKSWKIGLCSLLNWAFLLIKVIMKNWVVFRGKKCGARLELELGEVAAWWCHKLVEVNWWLKAFRDVGNMKNDEFGISPDLQVFYFIMWTQTHCQLLTFLNMLNKGSNEIWWELQQKFWRRSFSNCYLWPLKMSEKEGKNVCLITIMPPVNLCKKLQNCHQSFEQYLKPTENIYKLVSIWAIWVSNE